MTPVATLSCEPRVDRLRQSDAGTLTWSSVTAGRWAGSGFDAAEPAARFGFRCRSLDLTWDRAEVGRGVRVELPEILDRSLRREWTPDPAAPREARPVFAADAEPERRQAYWVVVVQVDGARAWSSPLCVTVAPAPCDRRGDPA